MYASGTQARRWFMGDRDHGIGFRANGLPIAGAVGYMTTTARFRVTGTADSVLSEVEGALGGSGIQVASSRRDGTRLLVQTRATLRSWGEEITFDVTNGILTVTSYARSQAFDWGKSADNVEALSRVFKARGWARV
jgi:hypothetical protein